MMQRPWDCAQPDEWLPQSLRLCWGSSSGDGGSGSGYSGDGGSGWGDTGATTGPGDWGSAGAADFSGSWASGDTNAWSGTAYDASTSGTGAGNAGDWGSFGATNYSGFNAPNPTFADIAGPNPGVTTGPGDWGSAGTSSFAGTGGGPAGAMFGADLGAGAGAPGQPSSGFWGDYGGSGNFFGDQGGSAYTGGPSGGSSFGGFGSAGTSSGGRSGGPLGASNVVAAAPFASRGETFADTAGSGSLAGPAGGRATSDAPTRGEAEVASAGPDVDSGRADADADAEPASFGEPASSEAAPEAEAGPSLSDGAPAGMIGGKDDAAPASQQTADRGETEAAPSAFGPQSLDSVFEGAAGPSQGYQEASQQLSDLTQSALAPQQDSFDSRFGFETAAPEPQTAGPNFNQAFEAFNAPGWNLSEQTAGVTGLAEPTDWGGNPLAASTDVSVGRDFDQVFADVNGQLTNYEGSPYADMGPPTAGPDFDQSFQAFDTPTGMDLAGDFATGRTTDLAQQLGLQDLTVAPGFGAGHAMGVTGMNLAPLAHDTDPTAPMNVELVPADQAPPPPDLTTPPPQEAQPVVQPTETTPVAPTEAAPAAPSEAAPAAPPEAQPAQPQETEQAQPQEAQPAPPSLIEQAQTLPSEVQPTAPPSLIEQAQPTPGTPLSFPGTPQTGLPPVAVPQQQPAEHDDAPEPQDTSQPPQDPNAPRPPENIPGQPIGGRGTYTNSHLDNPRVNSNYRDSGRTDYPQGRPGIDFRTARQAGIEPHFRIGDINVHDLDARLVERINRAMADMPANLRDGLVATSGWRPAHRGEAHEHGMDPRTSQESVYTRYNPNGRNVGPAARPGGSNHAPGRAIDFQPGPALTWLRANAGRYGLETLGRNFDIPHIQLQGARGIAGVRPSAQEQQAQRALDAQTRQANGQAPTQQAAVPTPRARPGDAPPLQVAQPRPPADIPPPAANLPPVAPPDPVAPRPPADIPAPAPFLAPPRAGRADPALQARTASQIAADLAAKGPRPTSMSTGQTALNGLARALAQAGIPAAIAQQTVTETARAGSRAAGYDPDGIASGYITSMTGTAMQGYQPAKPGEAQGPQGFQPDAPAAPGKQGALPGQQFADLSQSLGPQRQQPSLVMPGLDHLSPLTAPPAPPPTWGQPPAPPPPPMYKPGDPGMFNPFRGNEADATPSLMDMLGNVLSNFNPISTAEAKGRGRDTTLQQAIALAREGGSRGGQPGTSVVGHNVFTFYGPGASGPKGMEGPMVGSKNNPLTTLDDVRNGAGFVSLAGHPAQFGQQIFIGDITYTSPIDGKQYTLSNVFGRVDDTGGKFGGRDNPDQNHFDIAVGNFSRGWNDRTAGSLVASNYVTAVPGRGIGSDYAADDQGTAVGAGPPVDAPPADMRGLAKGGHVAKDEPVVVGEEGPETFVPDTAGTVVPHMPQSGGGGDFGRWPKLPTPDYPGRYAGVGREMKRQMREAQNPMPTLMDLIDSGRLPLNAANWRAMMNNPSLIALGRSRMGTVDEPAPEPAAEPPDPTNPMAQALGYGSIKRRPMQIGRQVY